MLLQTKNPFRNKEEKFITALEQFWTQYGNLPSCQKLIELEVVESQAEYDKLIQDDFVVRGLTALGIQLDQDLQILTPKQLAAIQVMFDFHDTRSDSKKLKDLGLSGQTWQNWLRDPIFSKFIKDRVTNLFGDNEHEIDRALFSKARAGNTEAIKLLYTFTGRLKTDEVPKIGNVEAHVFLMRLFEILQEELAAQPEKLILIGKRIAKLNDPYLQHPKVIEALPEKTNDLTD